MNIVIDQEELQEIIKPMLKEELSKHRLQFMSVKLSKLVELTGLSESSLQRHILNEPEIEACRKEFGRNVVYLYPEVMNAYKKVAERKGL